MTDKAHRVVVLALPGVVPLDFAIPVQVFAGPQDLPYRVEVAAPLTPLPTSVGFAIAPDTGLRSLGHADTIVVPGFVPHRAPVDVAVLTALRGAHRRGTRLISICTGAFALAQAGLLDGRPATTHWQNVGELAADHPNIDVRPDVLYVDDGDILTSAGVSSGMDLCLHVVRRDLGVDAAGRVARALVAAPHRDGNQAQFLPHAKVGEAEAPFAELCSWVLEHLAEPMGLEVMAARAAVSTRTLSRRFRDATGSTPLQWVLVARLDEARRLLETTNLSVDDVAERSGFGSGLNMRNHFRTRLSTTPTAYRRAFTG